MNYRNYSVPEAVILEQTQQFVDAIKHLDRDLAAKRLAALILYHLSDMSVAELMGGFIALVGHETSVD